MASHAKSEVDRYRKALQLFDEDHLQDPRHLIVQGQKITWSLFYHQRLFHWVKQLDSEVSESLKLAARCQHIKRWTIPRKDFPMDRSGYHRWRKTLKKFHAQQAGEILEKSGYDQETILRVQQLLQKLRMKLDPEVQLFENAICLVFLENELTEFLVKHKEEKVIEILQKTWGKMSSNGHQLALELVETLPSQARKIIGKAL